MNLVFDKNTLKVISTFDGNFCASSEEIALKQMFPNDFKNLALWQINKNINFPPVHLFVRLGEDKNPDVLIYKGREVYRRSKEDKIKAQEKRIEDGKKILFQILPKELRSPFRSDIIGLWKNSSYTNKTIVNSLGDFSYFSAKKILPVTWWGPFTDAGGYANMT